MSSTHTEVIQSLPNTIPLTTDVVFGFMHEEVRALLDATICTYGAKAEIIVISRNDDPDQILERDLSIFNKDAVFNLVFVDFSQSTMGLGQEQIERIITHLKIECSLIPKIIDIINLYPEKDRTEKLLALITRNDDFIQQLHKFCDQIIESSRRREGGVFKALVQGLRQYGFRDLVFNEIGNFQFLKKLEIQDDEINKLQKKIFESSILFNLYMQGSDYCDVIKTLQLDGHMKDKKSQSVGIRIARLFPKEAAEQGSIKRFVLIQLPEMGLQSESPAFLLKHLLQNVEVNERKKEKMQRICAAPYMQDDSDVVNDSCAASTTSSRRSPSSDAGSGSEGSYDVQRDDKKENRDENERLRLRIHSFGVGGSPSSSADELLLQQLDYVLALRRRENKTLARESLDIKIQIFNTELTSKLRQLQKIKDKLNSEEEVQVGISSILDSYISYINNFIDKLNKIYSETSVLDSICEYHTIIRNFKVWVQAKNESLRRLLREKPLESPLVADSPRFWADVSSAEEELLKILSAIKSLVNTGDTKLTHEIDDSNMIYYLELLKMGGNDNVSIEVANAKVLFPFIRSYFKISDQEIDADKRLEMGSAVLRFSFRLILIIAKINTDKLEYEKIKAEAYFIKIKDILKSTLKRAIGADKAIEDKLEAFIDAYVRKLMSDIGNKESSKDSFFDKLKKIRAVAIKDEKKIAIGGPVFFDNDDKKLFDEAFSYEDKTGVRHSCAATVGMEDDFFANLVMRDHLGMYPGMFTRINADPSTISIEAKNKFYRFLQKDLEINQFAKAIVWGFSKDFDYDKIPDSIKLEFLKDEATAAEYGEIKEAFLQLESSNNIPLISCTLVDAGNSAASVGFNTIGKIVLHPLLREIATDFLKESIQNVTRLQSLFTGESTDTEMPRHINSLAELLKEIVVSVKHPAQNISAVDSAIPINVEQKIERLVISLVNRIKDIAADKNCKKAIDFKILKLQKELEDSNVDADFLRQIERSKKLLENIRTNGYFLLNLKFGQDLKFGQGENCIRPWCRGDVTVEQYLEAGTEKFAEKMERMFYVALNFGAAHIGAKEFSKMIFDIEIELARIEMLLGENSTASKKESLKNSRCLIEKLNSLATQDIRNFYILLLPTLKKITDGNDGNIRDILEDKDLLDNLVEVTSTCSTVHKAIEAKLKQLMSELSEGSVSACSALEVINGVRKPVLALAVPVANGASETTAPQTSITLVHVERII